jgi:hypothetical protein
MNTLLRLTFGFNTLLSACFALKAIAGSLHNNNCKYTAMVMLL